MSEASYQQKRLDAARLYGAVQRVYSAIPFLYMKNGFSFPPWHYYVEMTRRCNLRCKMCQYIDWLENTPGKQQREGELTTDEWHNVIAQFHPFSLATFTGGEVFVRKDFLEILTHASRRTRTHFISNATLFDDERAAAVIALAPKRVGGKGLNFAGTSIEGPREKHDEIRRFKDGYKRTEQGMRALAALRDKEGKKCPLMHVTTVLQEDNVDELHYMAADLKDMGIDVWNLVTETRMHDLPELGDRDPASYNMEDIPWPHIPRNRLENGLNAALDAAKQVGLQVRLPRMPKEDLLTYYEQDGRINLKDYECRNAWNTMIISRLGDVYPCWITKVGNVRENTLKEIWNGQPLREFRQTCQKKLFAMCPGCCFLEHRKPNQESSYHEVAVESPAARKAPSA